MLCFFDSTKKREGKPEHTAVAGKAIKRVCVCVYVCDSSSCNTLDYDESGKRKKVKGQHHNVRYARQDKAHMDIENKKKNVVKAVFACILFSFADKKHRKGEKEKS